MIEQLLDQIYSQKELLIYLLGVFIVFIFVITFEDKKNLNNFGLIFLCLCSWVFIWVMVTYAIFGKNENK